MSIGNKLDCLVFVALPCSIFWIGGLLAYIGGISLPNDYPGSPFFIGCFLVNVYHHPKGTSILKKWPERHLGTKDINKVLFTMNISW